MSGQDDVDALAVRALGPIEVTVDRDPISIGAPLERAVLAFLALRPNESVTLGTLVDLLWGDSPPPSAVRGVQTQVFRLRKKFPSTGAGSPIETVGSAYRLRVQPGRVDALRCAALAADGRRDAGQGDHTAAAVAFREALALFRGSPVPDLGHTPAAQAARTNFEELRSAITVDLFDSQVASGASREIVADLENAIVASPYDERLYSLLMVALYRSGRQSDALGVFQRARSRLVGDLGLEPGPELRRAEEAILSHDPGLLPRDTPPARTGLHQNSRVHVGDSDRLSASWAAEAGIFVGRDAEMAVAVAVWDRVVATNRRRLLLVPGEAGVGKTRLTAELARHVTRTGGLVLRGGCDPGIGSYGPFTDALDTLADRFDPGTTRTLSEGIDPAASTVTRLVAPRPPTLGLPADVELDTVRAVTAVDTLLRRLSESVPTLLVLDDLHWAATPTIRLLSHMMRRAGNGRLLIVGTHRTGRESSSTFHEHIAELHRTDLVDTLVVHGLDRDGVDAFVSAEIGTDRGPSTATLASELLTATGGNPFFLRSLIRHLREHDVLLQREGNWHLEGPVNGQGIPTGIRDIIGSRLATLTSDTRTTLQAAAITGPVLDVELAVAATGLDDDVVLTSLESAVAAGLVLEHPDVATFTFVHDLVRQVLTDQVGATRKARWHWTAARTLHENRSGHPQAIGVHAAAGLGAAHDRTFAAQLLRTAATDAIAHGAPSTAAEFLETAAEALGPDSDPSLVADILTDRAVALLEADIDPDDDVFTNACDAAEQAALSTGDPERTVRAVTLDHRHQTVEHVDHRRLRAAHIALDAVPETASAERAILASFAAELRAYSAERDDRVQLSDLARSLLDDDTSADTRETVLISLALAHSMDPDELNLARELADQLKDLARPVGFAVATVVTALADIHDGRFENAEDAADLIRAAGGSRGSRAGVVVAASLGLSVAIARSDWSTFDRLTTELASTRARPRTAQFHATISRLAASAARVAGRPSERLAERLLASAAIEGYDDVYTTTAAWAHLLDGQHREAFAIWRSYRLADRPAAATAVPGAGRLPTFAAAAELAARYGTDGQMRCAYDLLAPYENKMVVSGPMPFGPVDMYLATLASRLGMNDSARRHLRNATGMCDTNGIRGWNDRIEQIRVSVDHPM